MGTTAAVELSSRLIRPEGVRRLGQALWMLVGQRVEQGDLLWARGLAGADGDSLLWRALCEAGALREPELELRPYPLAYLLCRLWGNETDAEQSARLVWTLPPGLSVDGVAPDGYVSAAIELVEFARSSLVLVSPYLEPKGMGRLHESLLAALHRGVAVLMLTHDGEDLSSLASASMEALRRDSAGLAGLFTVYTASALSPALLHLKLIVADETLAVLGSANVTRKGFGQNLEAGVLLGAQAVGEIGCVIQAAISSSLVDKVFSSR
jgi:hypothetical protein